MAQTVVLDVVIWAKHIHGDDLASRVSAMRGGEVLQLTVDGVRGDWRKMDDGRDGRPTPGIRPIGRTKDFWREVYAQRRGAVVAMEAEEPAAKPANPLISPSPASREERMAALQRLLSIRGRSPDNWKFSRQEIYDERDDDLEARRLAHR